MPEEVEVSQRTAAPAVAKPSVRLGQIVEALREVLFKPTAVDSLALRVDAIAADLTLFVARDVDQALYLLHRQWPAEHALYSVLHAARCAVACDLTARELCLPEPDAASLVKAALTMNIAITELQGALALRPLSQSKPSAEEAAAIANHPTRAVAILRNGGVANTEWLQAVEQHHERTDGTGYPTGTREPSRLARVLRLVDNFFAKITARASRPALPLKQAAAQLCDDADGRPIVEALIREFGLYPPGTFVRLANGDLGIVLRRGSRINTPLAVAVANRDGVRFPARVRRDTSDPRFAITTASNY